MRFVNILRSAGVLCHKTSFYRRFYIHGNLAQQKHLSYNHGTSDVPFLGVTIGQLVDQQAEIRPDKEVFVVPFQNIRKTFSEFKGDVDAFGCALLSLGLKHGDRVGMWGPNSYEWMVTQFATAKLGLIMVNVNPGYKAHELEFCLRKAQVKVLVAAEKNYDSESVGMLEQILPDFSSHKPALGYSQHSSAPDLKHVVLITKKNHGGLLRFQDVLDSANRELMLKLESQARKVQFDDAVNIQFTSGTTGNPKGATLTHHNVVNDAYFAGLRFGYSAEETRLCSPVPLYHCMGCVLASLVALVHGICTVLPAERFHAESTLRAINDERCTAITGVPTMYLDQIHHPNFSKYSTKTLHTAFMSGAPCPSALVDRLRKMMGIKNMFIGYGLTETSPLIISSRLGDPDARCTETVGTAMPHVEVRVVNDKDEIVPRGTTGEIQSRGYTTMKGYWEDEAKTKEFISPTNWTRTGDLGTMDENGYLKVVGRIKDMIIRGGENVYPVEIEQRLHQHPAVAEAYVVGVPDKRLGEELCCWLKLKSAVKEDELKDFCKAKLARFKVPKHFLILAEGESFPLTVTGKVQKYQLREHSIARLKLNDISDSSQNR